MPQTIEESAKEEVTSGKSAAVFPFFPKSIHCDIKIILFSFPDPTCCNPFQVHNRPIYKFLRVIQADDLKRCPNLIVGQFWCDNCRKMPSKC